MPLELSGITIHFDGVVALDDVSLTVGDGERLAILGPSGSGKSTLLRVICGLERPQLGTVAWDGRNLAPVPVHARGFGLMFQDYALFPHRDVAANVAFGLRMRGEPALEIGRRVAEVLEMVGLAGYGGRRPTELSGGEQQRVALARALAPQPRLLMLDEPLGALDRTLRERLLDELAALFRSLGLTLIYVTHDQEEALAMADRVAILRGGRVEAVAEPVELWRQPPSAWAARFLGLRNIAEAAVEEGMALTPWGSVPLVGTVASGRRQLLIRPESLRLDPSGPIRGVVAAVTFRGSRTVLRIEIDDAPPLDVHAELLATPPKPGVRVALAVDPAGVILLPDGDRASLSQ